MLFQVIPAVQQACSEITRLQFNKEEEILERNSRHIDFQLPIALFDSRSPFCNILRSEAMISAPKQGFEWSLVRHEQVDARLGHFVTTVQLEML